MILRITAALLASFSAYSQELYRIENFAGTDYAGDGGPAATAPLVQPQGIAFERDGSILFCDAGDNRLRRINPSGQIFTVAGDGWAGFRGDNALAVNARLSSPYGVAAGPKGDIYVADLGNARVRRITIEGIISTFAGGGDRTPSSDSPVPATEARLAQPRNIAVDSSGAVYVSDFGAHQVYRIGTDGQLLVIAGTGEPGYSGDGGSSRRAKLFSPAGLAVDPKGTLYVADAGNHRVRLITGGLIDSVRDGSGPIDFLTITSLALDSGGRLYTASGNTHLFLLAPNGASAQIQTAADEVAVDSGGRIFVVAQRQIRSYIDGQTRLVAGATSGESLGDGGPAGKWRFQQPSGLARDASGNLYVADSLSGRIRQITPDGTLSTLASGLNRPGYLAFRNTLFVSETNAGVINTIDQNGRLRLFSRGSESRPLRNPNGIDFDSRGDLYVADTGNNLIRKITPDGFVSTVAGGGFSESDGFGLAIQVKAPVGLAITNDNTVWFTEANRVRKITPDGRVSTVPGVALLDARGLRIDSGGFVWVSDALAHRVIRISPDGEWLPVAGAGVRGHSGDGGPAITAELNAPSDLLPVGDGTVLIADALNNRIRRVAPMPEAPPDQVASSKIKVLHPATGLQQAVAPGQIVWIESAEALPSGPLTIQIGESAARILSQTERRLTALVPGSESTSSLEVKVIDSEGVWAVAPLEIAPVAPGLFGLVENERGEPNGVDSPAARAGFVSVYLTGLGIKDSIPIRAEIGGYEVEVVSQESLEAQPGLIRVILRTPSGFAPSGGLRLQLWADGVLAAGEVMIYCR